MSNHIDRVLNAALCLKDSLASQQVFKIEPVLTKQVLKSSNKRCSFSQQNKFLNNRSMYGYHDKDAVYLKICLYNPDLIRKWNDSSTRRLKGYTYLNWKYVFLRLSDLLVSGAVMNESFQVFEAHVPYNLQVSCLLSNFNWFIKIFNSQTEWKFLIDYNLFGMNLIYLDSVKFRRMNLKIASELENNEFMEEQNIHQKEKIDSTSCKLRKF